MVFDAIDNSRINKNGIKLFALASTGLFLDGYDLSIITMAALVYRHSFISVNLSTY